VALAARTSVQPPCQRRQDTDTESMNAQILAIVFGVTGLAAVVVVGIAVNARPHHVC
jgi:hypothetical protein